MSKPDGTILFSTQMDNSELEKQVEDAKAEVKSIEEQINKLNKDKTKAVREQEKAQEKLNKAQAEQVEAEKKVEQANERAAEAKERLVAAQEKLNQIQREKAGYDDARTGSFNPDTATDAQAFVENYKTEDEWKEALKSAKSEVSELEKELKSAEQTAEKFGEKLLEAQGNVEKAEQSLKDAKAATDGISGGISSAEQLLGESEAKAGGLDQELRKAQEASAAMKNPLDAVSKGVEKFTKRLKQMALRVFVFNVILKALRAIKERLSDAISANEEAPKAVSQLKGAVNTAIQPIINLLIPAVTALCKALTRAVYLTMSLFGEDFVNSAKTAAQAIDDVANAKKKLAGFDEITTVGGDDNATSASYDFGETPTWVEAVRGAFDGFMASISVSVVKIKKSLSGLKRTLKTFALYLLKNFVPNIYNSFSEDLAPVFTDIMSTAVQVFAIDFENATRLISEDCDWLQTAFGQVEIVFTDMCATMKEKWDENGGSIMDGILEFKDGLWETFWDIYDGAVKPVIENIMEKVSWLWDQHLKPLWDNLVEFGLSLYDNILSLWNDLIKPLLDNVIAQMVPIISFVINTVADAVAIVVGLISDVIGVILKIVDGAITVITGVLTLDFKKAASGVEEIFLGIAYALIAIVKGAINTIILAINTVISGVYSAFASIANGLDSAAKTIGDIIGKDWSFSFPTTAPRIPYLAQGAVLPANHPFLAWVGDQKSGTNVEAPLSTIQDAVALVMEDNTNGMIAGFEALLEEIQRLRAAVEGIEVGDSTIGQAANRYNQRMAVIRG